MRNLEYLQQEAVEAVGQYEIVDTGWRSDGLFVVILGADQPALLESDGAQEYARSVAARRRHDVLVTVEDVEAGIGQFSYQRVFCFMRNQKKKWMAIGKRKTTANR